MSTDHDDRIDELTSELDDVTRTVEELEESPLPEENRESLGVIKSALEQATEAAEDLEDRQDD
jgi:hypothetical protein